MPIPKPKKGEEQNDYISRCVSQVKKLDPKRPQKQIIAICYSTWRRSKAENKEEVDKMEKFADWFMSELAQVTAMEKERKKRGMSVAQFYAFPRLKKLPIFDIAHTRNAMARFNQTKGWKDSDEKQATKNKIVRAAKKFGIDVDKFTKLSGERKTSPSSKKFTATSKQLGKEKFLMIFMENEDEFCEGWVFEPKKIAEKMKLELGSKVKKLSKAPLEMLSFDGMIPIGKPGASRNFPGIYKILEQGTYEELPTKEKNVRKYKFSGKKLDGLFMVNRLEDKELIESSKYQYVFDRVTNTLEDELLKQIEVLSKKVRVKEKLHYNSLKITNRLKDSMVPLTITGTALREGEWNGLFYPKEELMMAASMLQGKRLMLDHSGSVRDIAGKVTRT